MALLPPYPVYLTGVRNEYTDGLASYHDSDLPLGLLVQPLTRGYLRYQHLYAWCGIDNGRFTEVGRRRFRLDDYLDMTREAVDRFGDGLLFATAPDVPFDWHGTLRESLPVLPLLRRAGAPAAIVLQDGASSSDVPWDECDALFVGGSTQWKVGPEARALCREAVGRRKWVHMGRVNSQQRMEVAQDFGAGSADGTYLLHASALARAVVALRTLLLLLPGRARAEGDVAALLALREPSASDRARAMATLRSSRSHPLLPILADARARDDAKAYVEVTRAAVRSIAAARGEPEAAALGEVEWVGDGEAVEDVVGWLRALHRRAAPERLARSASEYGARRPNPASPRPLWRMTRAEFEEALDEEGEVVHAGGTYRRLGPSGPPWNAKVPRVDFGDVDLQDGVASGGVVTAATVLRDYGGGEPLDVYEAYVPSGDVPGPVLAEEEDALRLARECKDRQRKLGWPDEGEEGYEDCDEFDQGGGYDWDSLAAARSVPPAKLLVTERREVQILDGNHRVRMWDDRDVTHVPAWVLDATGHRGSVARALASGEKVPPRVLRDYPELVPPPRPARRRKKASP